jgi:hypothetical protein
LRLALSKGPNRVDVSLHLRKETDPVSETSYFYLLILESGQWTKSENPLIVCKTCISIQLTYVLDANNALIPTQMMQNTWLGETHGSTAIVKPLPQAGAVETILDKLKMVDKLVRIVNSIKSRPLNSRIFSVLCD